MSSLLRIAARRPVLLLPQRLHPCHPCHQWRPMTNGHLSPPLLSPPPPTPAPSMLARSLNEAIRVYPVELIASLAVLEMGSWQVTGALLDYAEIQFSLALVVAYAISVPVRKSLLPKMAVGFPLGVAIATMMPFYKQVRISELLNHPTFAKFKRSSPVPAAISVVAAEPSSERRWWHPIRWAAFLSRAADRYGLALLIGYRLAGSIIILTIYEAITLGVPMERIEHYLQWFGYSQDMRGMNKAAGYAASIVLSSALFPLTVVLAPFPARLLYRARQRIIGTKSVTNIK